MVDNCHSSSIESVNLRAASKAPGAEARQFLAAATTTIVLPPANRLASDDREQAEIGCNLLISRPKLFETIPRQRKKVERKNSLEFEAICKLVSLQFIMLIMFARSRLAGRLAARRVARPISRLCRLSALSLSLSLSLRPANLFGTPTIGLLHLHNDARRRQSRTVRRPFRDQFLCTSSERMLRAICCRVARATCWINHCARALISSPRRKAAARVQTRGQIDKLDSSARKAPPIDRCEQRLISFT